MIDGVGKSGSNRIDVARGAEQGGRVAAVGEKTAGARSAAVESAVFELVSAGAPVDAAKVASVRAAIAEGRYSVDPGAIAQKMVALDLPER
ncbi:flagellar biosynthesis anti-sigma factor FlgM [Sphingosinicella sp.]|uniref:flagellar biosynthesis anti-sigma factor FlgM n=1 Tax=Sphingosinicella sp. TaxID=1917971 RepID=UPI0040380CE9